MGYFIQVSLSIFRSIIAEIEYVRSHKELPAGWMGPYCVKGAFVTDMTLVKDVSILQAYVDCSRLCTRYIL